jgi:Flp pilus assembly pilin Flp
MRLERPRATMRGVLPPHRDEDGAGLVEYALLLALIAIVCVGALTFTGGRTSAKLSVLGETLVRDDESTTTSSSSTTTSLPTSTSSTTAPSSTTSSSTPPPTPSSTTTAPPPPPPTTIPKKCTNPGASNNPDCKIYFP